MDNMSDYIPDEVLISEVLPRLPLEELLRLCASSNRLKNICTHPDIWRSKIKLEFPEYMDKPDNFNWSQWYTFLLANTKQIPMVYHGDVIAHIRIGINNETVLMFVDMTIQKLNLRDDPIYLFFISENADPVIVLLHKHNTNTIIWISNQLRLSKSIDKLLVVSGEIPLDHLRNQVTMSGVIMENLFSRQSKYPIYGIIDDDNTIFKIFNAMKGYDQRPLTCEEYKSQTGDNYELIRLLQDLEIAPPFVSYILSTDIIEEYIRQKFSAHNSDKLLFGDINTQTYYILWDIQGTENICDVIKNRITQLQHVTKYE